VTFVGTLLLTGLLLAALITRDTSSSPQGIAG
jgi:hypothetical protein